MNKPLYRWSNNQIQLRSITIQDTELLVKWRSDPQVYRYFKNPKPLTAEQHIIWFDEKYQQDFSRQDFIVESLSGKPLGSAGAICSQPEKVVEISYLIDPAERGKGLAQVAVALLCERVLGLWQVEWLKASVHPQNYASIKFIEKMGFQKADEENGFFVYLKPRE